MKKLEPDIPRHLKQFLAEYLTQQRGCSLHTVWSYRDTLCSLLRCLQDTHGIGPNRIKVTDLSADNIMSFLNHLQTSRKNSDDTRNLRLSAIRTFGKYLRWKEPVLTSDLEGLLAIPSKRTTRQVLGFLNRDEMEAILEAPDDNTWSGKRDRALFAAMYNKGENPRFVVTSLSTDDFDAATLYEKEYCARGDMENRIKEQQLYLFADRTSASTMRANQLRLWLSSVAYVLVNALREFGLKGTQFEKAQCHTIRLKLFKVGAAIRVTVRRVWISFSKSYPYAEVFHKIFETLQSLPHPCLSPSPG